MMLLSISSGLFMSYYYVIIFRQTVERPSLSPWIWLTSGDIDMPCKNI